MLSEDIVSLYDHQFSFCFAMLIIKAHNSFWFYCLKPSRTRFVLILKKTKQSVTKQTETKQQQQKTNKKTIKNNKFNHLLLQL